MKKPSRRRQRKKGGFKPDRKQVEQATAYFLEHGGKINHIESTERTFEEFMAGGNSSGLSDVDDFLNGQT